METIINLCIVLGIPIIFFILCIRNIIRIIKAKKNNDAIKKSWVVKSIIFGVIFIIIIIFYVWMMYALSRAVAHM